MLGAAAIYAVAVVACKGTTARKARKLRTSGESMSGTHVAVTGAGTGIGRAIALQMAREPSVVTLLGLDDAELEETAGLIEAETHIEPFNIRDQAIDQNGGAWMA